MWRPRRCQHGVRNSYIARWGRDDPVIDGFVATAIGAPAMNSSTPPSPAVRAPDRCLFRPAAERCCPARGRESGRGIDGTRLLTVHAELAEELGFESFAPRNASRPALVVTRTAHRAPHRLAYRGAGW